jgi:hypothetical protein
VAGRLCRRRLHGRFLLVCLRKQMRSYPLGGFLLDRARMRSLLGDAQFRQNIENYVRLHF